MDLPADNRPAASREPASPHEVSVIVRVARVLLVVAAITAGLIAVVATGLVRLPGLHASSARAGGGVSAASRQSAADSQWAASTCRNLLDWKQQLTRDGTSLNLGFGAAARIDNAIAATRRMLAEENRLGLPPGAHTTQAQADAGRLRANIQSRLGDLERTASDVAAGNLAALPALIGDLKNDQGLGATLAGQLRRVVSVDLGLSLVETSACRQLAGSSV